MGTPTINRSTIKAAIGAPVLGAAAFTLIIYPIAVGFYWIGDAEYATMLMFDAIPKVWGIMLALSVIFLIAIFLSAGWKWTLKQHLGKEDSN